MSESMEHKKLKNIAIYWLKGKVTDVVCQEVDFYNIKSIADAVGLNFKRKEVRIVEVKISRNDLIRDKKLFDETTSYFNHAHYCYIMSPENIILPNEIPVGYGLLWVDNYENVIVVKKPTRNKKKLKTLFETTSRIASKKLTNTLLYQEQSKLDKDETCGFFDKKSKIKMISYRCPVCDKKRKDLTIIDTSTSVFCGCGTELYLEKLKYKIVTGFNNVFLSKIKNLL